MHYLEELNPVQREAVKSIVGPTLIVAGPGSGKTRVLTYRIIHLISSEKVDPFHILALTFTNKAAGEMRHRMEEIVGNEARNIFMGTFHSVFARILRVEAPRIGYPSNFSIYDTTDSRSLIKTIVKEMGLHDKLYKPSFVHARISIAKNSLIDPNAYRNHPEIMGEDASNGRPRLHEVYFEYAKRCFQAGAMDFDDLLVKMHEILSKHPEALYRYQHKFKFVLIDEFQDTNQLQYAIVKKLAAMHENITVVGDDAQSIYAFRGATIENILNFKKDYPDLKVFKLEQNYRSTKKIVEAANALINFNKNQIPKTIWTSNPDGELIKLTKAASDNEEGRLVSNIIQETRLREHRKNEDFAILYRTNAQSRAFEESLRRLNIPYYVYGGVSFYQRKEIKDLISYLRLTVNPHDEEALRRIINYPARGIGKTTIEKATVLAKENNMRLWDVLENVQSFKFPARTKKSLSEFVHMIKSFSLLSKEQNAFEIATHIAKSSGIMKDLYNDKSVEGLSRYENLQELLNGINEFAEDDTIENDTNLIREKSLGAYLQNITLLTTDDLSDAKQDHVRLMTIHSAKGLEFPYVFVVGLEENLFPSNMSSFDRDDLEEERRLFYVAVTRSKERLFLSYATTRFKFGTLQYCEPSRFIEELPEDLLSKPPVLKKSSYNEYAESVNQSTTTHQRTNIQLKKKEAEIIKPDPNFKADNPELIKTGMQVIHQRFGKGKVISMDGNNTTKVATIFFEQSGQKKIVLKYAKLRIAH